MTFTQPIFFLFIAAFFLGWHYFAARSSFRLAYLAIASLIFYSYGNPQQVLALLAVGLISFVGAIVLERYPRYRLPVLAATILLCLGPLVWIRYRDFAMVSLAGLLGLIGVSPAPTALIPEIHVLPPLGISFYTLQAVGYLLDVRHGRLKAARNPVSYFTFLALFPKLLSGPIERGKDLLSQLEKDSLPLSEQGRWEGTRLIAVGFFLKVVIADNLAPFVDSAFSALAVRQNMLYWWVVITAFAFQLYADFSGYSAIAVGLGKWMGLDLTVNFKHPYLSTSLSEFWTRWHISLSSWLRDYVFFPLNRSRLGRRHPYLSLWITMLVSGLWHGAAWHYLFWGGLHGLYNSLERLTGWPNQLKGVRMGIWLARLLVLFQLWTAWVFFRSNSVAQGWQILRAMASFKGGWVTGLDPATAFFLGLGILPEIIYLFHLEQKLVVPERLKIGLEVAFTSLLIAGAVLLRGPGSQFIYIQF